MRTAATEQAGGGRYETFVLRLWVEGAGDEHGEIRHVQSNAALRFHDVQAALEFVRQTIDQRSSAAASAPNAT